MNPKSITVPALPEALPTVLDFITQILDGCACPPAAQTAVEIAAEEIFINIAHYAYAAARPAPASSSSPQFPGQATITCCLTREPPAVTIRFTDTGTPYNPLAKPDPDISLDTEARQIGGLGIYMVKNSMDSIQYEHRSGQNILTITKRLA